MGIARLRAPQAQGVAAGLNIAGFNSGIALGAWAGGLTLGLSGWPESDWPAGCSRCWAGAAAVAGTHAGQCC